MPAKHSKLVWAAVCALAAIGIAAVIVRLVLLAKGPRTAAGLAGVDDGFAAHPVLTLIHIIPGLLFMLLAPLQFVVSIRTRHPRLHRWIGRTVLTIGLVIGVSALVMTSRMAVGGANETAAVVLFDLLFLFSLVKAYIAVRCKDFTMHRTWMIRMFGIGLGVATTRPVMGIFFATSRFTHLTPHEFFGTAFWIGFTVTLVAAESWINYTRPRAVAGP